MTELSEERLVAYLDGELEPCAARRVERALAGDPEARRRLRRLESSAAAIKKAYQAPMQEPVPEHLMDTVLGERRGDAAVVDLGAARARRTGWSVRRMALPLAASVALAVGLVSGLQIGGDRDAGLAGGLGRIAHTGALATDGPLHAALETAVSGALVSRAGPDGRQIEVTPIMSFQDRSGRFCREYRLSVAGAGGADGAVGLACRADGLWHGEAVVAAKVGDGDAYRPASGPVLGHHDAAIGELMADAPLTRDGEATLIDSGWR